MDNVDEKLVNRLVFLGLKPLKRALVTENGLIISSFYLESEAFFLKEMGQLAFDPSIEYVQRKKILLLLTKYIN